MHDAHILMDDGSKIESDLVLASDDIHSLFRDYIHPRVSEAKCPKSLVIDSEISTTYFPLRPDSDAWLQRQ